MRSLAILLVIAGAACGDDGDAPKPAKRQTPAGATAPPPGSGSNKQLPTVLHAEDQVSCKPPRSDAKKCDPKAPKPVRLGVDKDKDREAKEAASLACPENEYCLETSEGFLCGKCAERDRIRHVFQPVDFAADQNRDPFQSFVVKVIDQGSGSDNLTKDLTNRCPRPDQLVATNYSYKDLQLVGIVAQGTQRKVLMMDPVLGYIIKRGDCVGKEKAWVKEIGENFICFETTPDPTSNRPAEANCVELHTKTVAVTSLPTPEVATPPAKSTTITPVVPPPPTLPTKTKQPEAPAPQAPQQAPTNLKP